MKHLEVKSFKCLRSGRNHQGGVRGRGGEDNLVKATLGEKRDPGTNSGGAGLGESGDPTEKARGQRLRYDEETDVITQMENGTCHIPGHERKNGSVKKKSARTKPK